MSADHRLVAFAVDIAGDERFDLTVRDIESGEVLDTSITGIGYGVELSRDGRFVFYTRLDDAWRPHQLWRHRVGGDPAEDVLVHQEDDERFWMGVAASRDERWLLLGLGSKTTSEVHVLDADDPEGRWRVLAPRREGVEYDVEPAADRFLIVHNTDTPDADLAWAPFDATSHEQWVPWLRSGEGERFVGVDAFDAAAVLTLRTGGLTALRVLPRDPGAASGHGEPWDVAVDQAVHSIGLGDNPEPAQRALQVVVESWATPRTVLDVDLATRERTLLKRQPVLGDFDVADYAERREWATASDGTLVPVSVVHRVGVEAGGGNPGVVTAYGSYEISSDPYFSVARLSLLDRGVVYAVAHVRGGGEMGRRWYDDGKLLAKTNTFTDTLAAVDHLVSAGWIAADRVGLEGGSAGGLLVGAVLNLAPERFRVAHAAVPFVDALTTMLQPDLPLTVGEWEEWGQPARRPRGVRRDARLRALRERARGRLPGGAGDLEPARHPGLRHRAGQVGRPGCARPSRATRCTARCCCAPSSPPGTAAAAVGMPRGSRSRGSGRSCSTSSTRPTASDPRPTAGVSGSSAGGSAPG